MPVQADEPRLRIHPHQQFGEPRRAEALIAVPLLSPPLQVRAEAGDLDAAVEIVTQVPTKFGRVEVRPLFAGQG
jgi:hypothetical protein